MQRYTLFFIIVNALHILGGSSTHHQELKNCTQHRVCVKLAYSLLAGSGSSKQA
jgi:hypothetical protein